MTESDGGDRAEVQLRGGGLASRGALAEKRVRTTASIQGDPLSTVPTAGRAQAKSEAN